MIRNISISDITGTFDSFGTIASNPNTDISDISLTNIKVNVTGNPQLNSNGVTGLTLDNVVVNDTPMSAAAPAAKP